MNRTEYMQAVYATELDPASKAILVYLGFRKNWKEGSMAFPSTTAIAKHTGFGIATIKRRMPELRAKGYLCDTGQRKGRGVIVYDLADPTSITVIPGSITVIPQEYQSDTAAVSERYTEQVHEQERELVMEQVQETPVPSGPVVTEVSHPCLREEDSSLVYLKGTTYFLNSLGVETLESLEYEPDPLTINGVTYPNHSEAKKARMQLAAKSIEEAW